MRENHGRQSCWRNNESKTLSKVKKLHDKFISASGKSLNIINSVISAKKKKFSKIITLSGFKKNNKLKKIGDINFWIDSDNYNIIENSHQVILLTLIDYICNKKY